MALSCRAYAPVPPREGRISSRYGLRPGRTTGRIRHHAGLDVAAPRGTRALAIKRGTVERTTSDSIRRRHAFSGYGNGVVINHGDGFWSFYAHLDEVLVDVGAEVVPGQTVGLIGNTSNGKFRGMGVHLHLEVRGERRDGSSPFPGPYGVMNIDPEDYLSRHGIATLRRRFIVTDRACVEGPGPVAMAGLGKVRLPSLGATWDSPPETFSEDYEPPVELGAALWKASLVAGGVVVAVFVGWWLGTR